MKTINIRGEEFPNVEAVAERFGLSVKHVKLYLSRGKLDGIGLKAHAVKPTAASHPPEYTVMVRGRLFESVSACAAHFKLDPSTIRHMVRRGRTDFIGNGKGRFPSKGNPKPLNVGRFSWPSRVEAAKRLGFSESRLHALLKEGRFDLIIGRAMALDAKEAAERAARIKREEDAYDRKVSGGRNSARIEGEERCYRNSPSPRPRARSAHSR